MKKPNLLFKLSLCLSCVVFILIPIWVKAQNHNNKYGGTVVIGMKGDFDSFNELNAADSDALQVIQNMLFMSLTRLDENLEFTPYLAQFWEFSNGDSTLTFFLRDDVLWTDGMPTTAADVLFTYELATHPKVAYPASSRFDLTERVEVPDKYSVRFHFKRPYPDALFDTQIPILPKHVLEKIPPEKISQSGFNRNPIGNGPFKLVEWQGNQRVIFAGNPTYAFGRPYLERVIFSIIPDETVLFTNLMTDAIDVVPALKPRDFAKVQAENSLRAIRYDGREFGFVAWNLKRPLFGKPIRQALTHAINKQEIIDTLFEGFAKPAKGPLLPFAWAFAKNLPDLAYDPERAKRILEKQGWQDSDGDGILDKAGNPFEISIKTNVGSQRRKDVAVMVQAQLKQVGVQANVELVEWNLFIDQVFGQQDFDAVIMGWDADFTVNPIPLWHSDSIEDGYNFVSYQNSRVDSLLKKGRATSKRDLALPYWHEFQKIILDDCPYTFLYIPDKLAGYNQRIRDVKMDVRGFLYNIHEWWIPMEKRRDKSPASNSN